MIRWWWFGGWFVGGLVGWWLVGGVIENGTKYGYDFHLRFETNRNRIEFWRKQSRNRERERVGR